MPVAAFALTPAEERSRSITVVGDTVVLRDPHRLSRVVGVLPLLVIGSIELFLIGFMRQDRRSGKLTFGDGPPLDHPELFRLAGAVAFLLSIVWFGWAVRGRAILSPQGLTTVARRRHFMPWDEVDVVYRRTDLLRSWRPSFGSRKRLEHTLVIEHRGTGRPIFATTGKPDELDLAVEVIWRYRHEDIGPWERNRGGADPVAKDTAWTWTVAVFAVVQLAAVLAN